MKRVSNRILLSAAAVLLLALSGNTAPAAGRIDLQALTARKVPILLEFGRGWCIPCKYMKPILKDMEQAYAGRAIVTTVDMDANADLVRAFGIRMMPTQVFLAPDGKEFHRNEGTFEREQIAQVFAKMGLAAPAPASRQPAAPQSATPQASQQGQKRLW